MYMTAQKLNIDCDPWESNDALPEATQARIRLLITESEQKLADLDIEHTVVRAYLAFLETKKTTEIARLSALHAVISPVRALPTEILCEIFLACVDSQKVFLPLERNSYPWKLGHVCSRWRKVLWETPGIWDRINISGASYTSTQRILEPLHGILSRNTALIKLSVTKYPSDGFVQLLPFSHRFKSLSLWGLDPQGLGLLLSLPPGSLDQLECLKIDLLPSPPAPNETIPSILVAPSLRTLELDGDNYTILASHFLSPVCHQLTEVKLWLPTKCLIIHTVLQQCSQLVRGDFCIESSYDGDYSSSPCVATNLEYLRFYGAGDFDWDLLLQPLIVPALEELYSMDADTFSPLGLTSLIERSGCTITTIEIESNDTGVVVLVDRNIVPMLRALPFMDTFRSSIHMPSTVFVEMKGGLLPCLIDSSWTLFPKAFRALLDFLDSKCQVSPTLAPCTRLEVWLYNRSGYKDVCNHLRKHQSAYIRAGIYLQVYNVTGGYFVAIDGVVCSGENDEDDADSLVSEAEVEYE